MNEIEETYESIGCQNEQRIRQAAYSQTNNQFYTLPLRSRLAPVNEYEIPLTNRPQARSQTDTGWTDGNNSVTYLANNQGVKNKCTKNCLVVISVLLALLFVLTSAAFCFSIFKDEIIPMQSGSAQHSASSGSEELVNQTHLLNEINILKVKLNKLTTDAMNTQDYIRSVNKTVQAAQYDISSARHQFNTVQRNLSLINSQVNTVQSDLRIVSSNQTILNDQIIILRAQISTINRNMTTVNNQMNNYTHISYQNCHQQTSSCYINTLINDNKRLYCSTGRLTVNKTVSKIKQSKYNSVE